MRRSVTGIVRLWSKSEKLHERNRYRGSMKGWNLLICSRGSTRKFSGVLETWVVCQAPFLCLLRLTTFEVCNDWSFGATDWHEEFSSCDLSTFSWQDLLYLSVSSLIDTKLASLLFAFTERQHASPSIRVGMTESSRWPAYHRHEESTSIEEAYSRWPLYHLKIASIQISRIRKVRSIGDNIHGARLRSWSVSTLLVEPLHALNNNLGSRAEASNSLHTTLA